MTKREESPPIGLANFDPEKNQNLELWFYDSEEYAHGCQLRIKLRDVLCHYRSDFQEIAIFQTENLGRMLVLDNITMLTEFDESAYHEMIVHVPLLVHPRPARILIIGGGDGGTAREVLKHPEVEAVHVCELDREVVKACREYLPSLAGAFDDPRVSIFYRDGAEFVRNPESPYDVIIVDSTDPIGPGQVLFQRPFYENTQRALSREGIMVAQCESIYFHPDVIRGVASIARSLYPKAGYYQTLVPTYPSGVIGFMFCSLEYDPIAHISLDRAARLQGLRYYTPELHRAAFTLPRFCRDLID